MFWASASESTLLGFSVKSVPLEMENISFCWSSQHAIHKFRSCIELCTKESKCHFARRAHNWIWWALQHFKIATGKPSNAFPNCGLQLKMCHFWDFCHKANQWEMLNMWPGRAVELLEIAPRLAWPFGLGPMAKTATESCKNPQDYRRIKDWIQRNVSPAGASSFWAI